MSKRKDIFAEIAASEQTHDRSILVQPKPEALDEKYLPIKNIKSADFKPASKIDTAEKLKEELERYRKTYAKFMADYSPELKSYRKQKFLRNFDFRYETQKDSKCFSNVLNGRGKWEGVTIPHYGGPIGRATSYYRCKFDLEDAMLSKDRQYACFKGVDYKAQIFVNGKFLGANEGFFMPFEFDFTSVAKEKDNVLVVKVENDAICMGNRSWQNDGGNQEGDKIYAATGCGWDEPGLGWSHCPPGMGIYQDVYIESRPDLYIKDIFVQPDIKNEQAQVWLEAFNCDIDNKDISFEISAFGKNFRKTVVKAKKCKVEYAGPGVNYYRVTIDIKSPKLWSLDTPWLYKLQAKLLKDSNCIDSKQVHFGMRSFEMDTENKPYGKMRLNGTPLKLRGANTMGHLQQCVVKKDFKQLIDDILLAKICNMNFYRLTQRPVQPEIYEYCDMLGLMAQTDFPLFGVLRRNQFCEAVRQVGEMERLLRNHPCNIMISYINEPFYKDHVNSHRHLVRRELEDFFTVANIVVKNLNPDRVIKPVDGDYDPPAPGLPDNHCYCGWYNGHGLDIGKLYKGYWQQVKPDWVYGCGEFGAEGLEEIDIMKKHYPSSWLPQNEIDESKWSPGQIYRAQTGDFHYLWYETQSSIKDWIKASQAHQDWANKLMIESFRRDNRMHSIAIHLFIDSFPSGWMKTIMDFKRRPKTSFFSCKNALEPIIVSIRNDRNKFFSGEEGNFEIYVCNDTNEIPEQIELHYKIECDGEVLFASKAKADIECIASKFQGFLKYKMPNVSKRTQLKVTAGLVDRTRTLTDNSFEFEVFPKPLNIKTEVYTLGKNADLLSKQLNISVIKSIDKADVILVSDVDEYLKSADKIDRLVKKGTKVIFMPLDAGEYQICGNSISVAQCGMRNRHFVNRNTGHKLVSSFKPNDFKWFYDEEADYVTPFISNVIERNDFEPVIYAGNGMWKGGPWQQHYAVAEKTYGFGQIILCQLELLNRCKTNPIAAEFLSNLINKE